MSANRSISTIDSGGAVSEMNPRIIDTVRELTDGAMIMLPSSLKDHQSSEVAENLERYVVSPGTSSRDRVALMKMAWDMIGTEFAVAISNMKNSMGEHPFC
jgi:aromatic ring hydroxylase